MTAPNLPAHETDMPDEFEPEYDPQAFEPEATGPDHNSPPTPAVSTLPDPNRRLGRTGPLWGVFFLVAVVILALILLIRGGNDEPATPAIQVTAGAPGGMILPTEVISPTATPLPPTATPIPVLEVGQKVQVANTDGEGIRLRDEPSTSAVTLEIYKDGDLFTVVEPSSDYAGYPVEAETYRWYRIRAEDGLVGWTVYEYLEAVSGE